MAKNKFDQNHLNIVRRRKQVVVIQQPENQTVLNTLAVVPGRSPCKTTADRNKFHERDIPIFSDSGSDGTNSIVTLKLVKQDFLIFQGQTRKLLSYVDVNLENSNSDTVTIHIHPIKW